MSVDTRDVIWIEDENRFRVITFDRRDQLNAFNDAMYDAVRDALNDAAERDDVACVVVTGSGRAFSAGQDLQEMGTPTTHEDGQPHGFNPFMDALDSFPKPLLAAVNGVAVGIGLTMLLHCDIVYVSSSARLRVPFVSLGVTTEAASSYLLPNRIGWQEASKLLYTGEWLPAERAVEVGLATRTCEPGELWHVTTDMAARIAKMPISSLVATKQLLLAGRRDGVAAARERENEAFGRLVGGAANREALTAFLEKRDPNFTSL